MWGRKLPTIMVELRPHKRVSSSSYMIIMEHSSLYIFSYIFSAIIIIWIRPCYRIHSSSPFFPLFFISFFFRGQHGNISKSSNFFFLHWIVERWWWSLLWTFFFVAVRWSMTIIKYMCMPTYYYYIAVEIFL